jgi:hypothetical protein
MSRDVFGVPHLLLMHCSITCERNSSVVAGPTCTPCTACTWPTSVTSCWCSSLLVSSAAPAHNSQLPCYVGLQVSFMLASPVHHSGGVHAESHVTEFRAKTLVQHTAALACIYAASQFVEGAHTNSISTLPDRCKLLSHQRTTLGHLSFSRVRVCRYVQRFKLLEVCTLNVDKTCCTDSAMQKAKGWCCCFRDV